jgi:hypothetical protein
MHAGLCVFLRTMEGVDENARVLPDHDEASATVFEVAESGPWVPLIHAVLGPEVPSQPRDITPHCVPLLRACAWAHVTHVIT